MRPRDRDIAMVFQNYALYPQLSVAENMGFALKQQGVPKEERIARVREVARVLDLEPYLDRKPKHLSGGQRQRVAMGRAIVRRPAVYLMDEPLSNLDAKLRVQTRTEVVELQDRLGVTTVYVTHDQVEAMTMGDRVAVLKDGVLQQCDAPGTLYHEPTNLFVAGFIGSPAMNLVALERRAAAQDRRIPARARRRGRGRARRRRRHRSRSASVPRRCRSATGRSARRSGRSRTSDPRCSSISSSSTRARTSRWCRRCRRRSTASPGDTVGLQITGTTHLFAGDGSRLGETTATFRQAPSEGDSVTRIS